MKKLILLIPLLLILTGCNNYRELNELAVISGISITKEKDEYEVNVEIINPKKEQDVSNSKEPDCIIYTGKDKSIQGAIRSIVKESPQKLYGAHVNILIIDEKIAKDEIKDILDFLSRDPEIRSEFYCLISDTEDNLKVITPLINISSKNIMESMKSTTNYLSTSFLLTNHELLDNYLNPHKEIVIPSIKLKGNEDIGETNKNIERTTTKSNNIISNLKIFKDNKLVGTLTEKEGLAYNIINNNSKTFIFRSEFSDKQYVVNEIISTKTSIEPNVKDKTIMIKVKGTAAISEVDKDIDITKNEGVAKIEKKLNKDIEKLIANTIKDTTTKYNSDIYGFEDLFYKKDPKLTKKLTNNYKDSILKELKIKVKSSIDIIEKGNINGGVHEKRK